MVYHSKSNKTNTILQFNIVLHAKHSVMLSTKVTMEIEERNNFLLICTSFYTLHNIHNVLQSNLVHLT